MTKTILYIILHMGMVSTYHKISSVAGHQNWGPNFQHLEVEPLRQSDAVVGCFASEPKGTQETERGDLALAKTGYIGISMDIPNVWQIYGKSLRIYAMSIVESHQPWHAMLQPSKPHWDGGVDDPRYPKVLANRFLTTDAFVAAAPFLLSLALCWCLNAVS